MLSGERSESAGATGYVQIIKEKVVAKVSRRDKSRALRLICDDPNDEFFVQYTNIGEPFREGINIGVENNELDKEVLVMLEDREAMRLRDLLLKLYPNYT